MQDILAVTAAELKYLNF